MTDTKGKPSKGCVVFMKEKSGLTGYGNPQCISDVCEALGEIGLYGHNLHYKIYDIDRIVEYPSVAPETIQQRDALLAALVKAAPFVSMCIDANSNAGTVYEQCKQAIALAEE